MSLRQKVGQVFIWSYPGAKLNARAKRWLGRYQPGALIVFSHNIKSLKQISRLNTRLQSFARAEKAAPFFLMIDQEGGTVNRLRTEVPLPSALAIGHCHDRSFIQDYARANGELLEDMGFNVNLAPVLDISNPKRPSFIGSRAFGDDPRAVAAAALAYSRGLSSAGILPTAKHFPGHGGVVQDSHRTVPEKWASSEELLRHDLLPFAEFAAAPFPKAIMVAHLAVPNVDRSGLPATYSRLLLQNYLREKLKYSGLILTDDLEMKGAAGVGSVGERAVRAFLAGNDMLMMAGGREHQRLAFNAVLAAVRSGRIPVARLDQSVAKILRVKRRLRLPSEAERPDPRKAAMDLREVELMGRKILRENFDSSIKGTNARLPILNRAARIVVFSADRRFYRGFHETFQGASRFFRLAPRTLDQLGRELKPGEIGVYYASGNITAHWLSRLSRTARSRMIVINTMDPGEVSNQSEFLAILNINSRNPESGRWLAELLRAPTLRFPAGVGTPGIREARRSNAISRDLYP